jgi:CrcB protein
MRAAVPARRRHALDPRELAAIFAGGFVGAVARAAVADAWAPTPGHWPWATFAVNVAGAFLLGWWITRLEERDPVPVLARGFLGPGVCGALTTFSTLQLELLEMLDDGALGLAAGYAAASVLAGFLAVAAATRLAWAVGGERA